MIEPELEMLVDAAVEDFIATQERLKAEEATLRRISPFVEAEQREIARQIARGLANVVVQAIARHMVNKFLASLPQA